MGGERSVFVRVAGLCAGVCGAIACVATPSTERGSSAEPEPEHAANPRAALAHDVFVWQRRWTAPVRDAVQNADFRRLIVLLEEVEWDGETPLSRPSEADLAALVARARPVGVAVRVGLPDAGWGPSVATATIAAVRRVRGRVESAGLHPAELHLDLDVPTARLGEYAAWLPQVRAAWPGVALSITGLPTWLDQPTLPAVLAAVDDWVLQVHWLRPGPPRALFDRDEALAAVKRAGELGRPFRVALPTYTSGGVRADPAEMAARVAGWQEDAPAAMEGIAWFRLPVAGDATTWPISALGAVREGRVPRVSATAEAVLSDGAWDVVVRADGEDTLAAPCVTVRWSGGNLADADASRGRVRVAEAQAWWSLDGEVQPGEALTAGWFRLAPGARIDAVAVVDDVGCGVRAVDVAPG
jgi:hypothetical protein